MRSRGRVLRNLLLMEGERSAIQVEITDDSVEHCLKIVFQPRNAEQPIEIYLHTTQAIHLVHKLSLVICELHHRDSALLLQAAATHGLTK